MASPQPVPPTNPFDGFDNYSTVAQQPLQQQQQQQQPIPPNQRAQQPPQPVAHQQIAATATTANPFGFSSSPPLPPATQNNPNPFSTLPGGGSVQHDAHKPAVPMAHHNQHTALNYPPRQHPPPQQQQQQQLVPLAPNTIVQSPWAVNPVQLAPPVHQHPGAGALVAVNPAARGQTYDPFGVLGTPPAPPPPNPIQQPSIFQAQQHQPQLQAQSQFQSQLQVQTQPQLQAQPHPYAQQPHPVQPPTAQQNLQVETRKFDLEVNQSILPEDSEDEGLALIDVELDSDDGDAENLENHRKEGEFENNSPSTGRKKSKSRGSISSGQQRNTWDRNPDLSPPPPLTTGRRYAEYLADNSARPVLSSPIPRWELVHHSGYVLSRISFRTVLMRKWKQTFWIQYGPTQLLFFRTFSDYEDWLNNPYHTQKAREFLVKLRVDFVSDLKKSSVMGYQVTQVRRKPYGKNVMLHFKLERWMDYGPTIAAAFAAREDELMNSPSHSHHNDGDGMNTSNDVAALRKIILGCMRNARDAASSALEEDRGYRGRYDAEREREERIPNGSRNAGYHQGLSAERGQRRRNEPERPMPRRSESPGTESSEDELETEHSEAPPVVDLLG